MSKRVTTLRTQLLIFLGILCLGGILLGAFFFLESGRSGTIETENRESDHVSGSLGGTELVIETAISNEERVKGLSDRPHLGDIDGLLLVFPNDGRHGIWMKDMHFSLDLLWIAADGEVVHIEENISPDTYPESFTSPRPARAVLEVAAGRVAEEGWSIGDSFTLNTE